MYQKEIIYIGLYKSGSRIGSAGFLKVENRDRESRMYLKIQNIPLGISGRYPIRIYNGSDWKELSGITIQDGCGNWEETVTGNADHTILLVSLTGGYSLEGKSKSATEINVPKNADTPDTVNEGEIQDTIQITMPDTVPDAIPDAAHNVLRNDIRNEQQQTGKEDDRVTEKIIVTEELPCPSSENIDIMPQNMPGCNLKEDKWEQILDLYEKIHPYGDGRVYVKLEPKDFVILQSKYQHLVNNSFLLHGFYNYRYIILGKEQDYYLGVPGVFYEREKMVAQMFGFEAFECPGGNVRAGEFGYYLRKVEL